jgi:hypothetical protein
MTDIAANRMTHAETDVLDSKEMCDALKVSIATLNRMDLPTVYLGKRSRRWVWGQVLECLKGKAA